MSSDDQTIDQDSSLLASDAKSAENESTDDKDGPGLAKTKDMDTETSEAVLLSRLESLVFVSVDPISVRRLARILSLEGKRVRELLEILTAQYENRGIVLEEISGGFQYRSHPDNAAVIRHVFKQKPFRISRAALETLAIVAYRQPLTRAEAEDIRGVDCGGVLKYLFEKNLVRVIGRKEVPGRPIIYGTSPAFLELFGLKSLADLPALHEFSELWDEHQEFVDIETPADETAEEADETDPEEPDPTPPEEDETLLEEQEDEK